MPPTEHWDTDATTTARVERIGRLADMAYVYIYRWGPRWPEIPGGLNRKGQPCKVTARGRTRQGHIGIVSEVVDGKVTKVIHCAASHPPGRAVQETGPEVFTRSGAITVRRKA